MIRTIENDGVGRHFVRALFACLASALLLGGVPHQAAAQDDTEAATQATNFEIMGTYAWEEEAILADGMEWQVQYETQIFGDLVGGKGTILLGNGTEFNIENLRKTQSGNYVLTTDCMKSYIAEANGIEPGCQIVNMMLRPEGQQDLYEGEFMGNVGNVLTTFTLELFIYDY